MTFLIRGHNFQQSASLVFFFVKRKASFPNLGKDCRRKQQIEAQHLTNKFYYAIQRMRHGRWLQVATLTKPNRNLQVEWDALAAPSAY